MMMTMQRKKNHSVAGRERERSLTSERMKVKHLRPFHWKWSKNCCAAHTDRSLKQGSCWLRHEPTRIKVRLSYQSVVNAHVMHELCSHSHQEIVQFGPQTTTLDLENQTTRLWISLSLNYIKATSIHTHTHSANNLLVRIRTFKRINNMRFNSRRWINLTFNVNKSNQKQ